MSRRKSGYILLLILSVLYSIWLLSPIKLYLRDKLISEVNGALNGAYQIHAQNLSIGAGFIGLDSLQVVKLQKSRADSVIIPHLRIHYRVWPLLIFRASIKEVVSGISVESPEFVFCMEDLHSEGRQSTKPITWRKQYLVLMDKIYKFINTNNQIPEIGIHNACLKFSREGAQKPLLKGLSGSIKMNDSGLLETHLRYTENDLLHPELEISAFFNSLQKNLTFTILFNDFKIKHLSEHVQSKALSFSYGRLTGYFNGLIQGDSLINSSISAQIDASRLEGSLYDKLLEIDSLKIFSDNGYLIADTRNVLWGSNEFGLMGLIDIVHSGQTNLKIQSSEFNLSSMNYYLNKKNNYLEGSVSLDCDFNWEPGKPIEASAFVQGDSLKIGSVITRGLLAKARIHNSNVLIDRLNFSLPHGQIGGNGKIQLSSSAVNINLHHLERLNNSNLSFISRGKNMLLKNSISLSGNLQEKSFTGKSTHVLLLDSDSLLAYKGDLDFSNDSLLVKLNGLTTHQESNLYALLTNIFEKPEINMVEIHNVPIYQFLPVQLRKKLSEKVYSSIYLSGNLDYLKGKMSVYNPTTLESYLEIEGDSKNLWTEFMEFNGKMALHSPNKRIDGNVYIAQTPRKLFGFISVDDIFRNEFSVTLSDQKRYDYRFNLSVPGVELQDYLDPSKKNLWEGRVAADIRMEKLRDTVSGEFSLSVSKAILNGVGYYELQTQGKISQQFVNFDSMNISLNNVPMLSGKGNLDTQTDELLGIVEGDSIESHFISETLFGRKGLVKGLMDLSARVRGTLQNPVFSLKMEMEESEIYKEPLQAISLKATDTIAGFNIWNPSAHHLTIDSIGFRSTRGYLLNAKGRIPLSTSLPVNMTATASGNILAFLPRWQPYFQDVWVNGDFGIKMRGTFTNPEIDELNLQIYDGHMKFEKVLFPVRQIKADIVKHADDPFVNIREISGIFNSDTVWVNSIPDTLVRGNPLPSWEFPKFNVDLGVLTLKTSKKGMPLSVVGLQENGVPGWYYPSGLTEEEKFYFAGPPEEPHVRGKVRVQDARVTFPFPGMEEVPENPGKVIQFLLRTNWDVLATPGKGLTYFVDIPAYVGSVYMDLTISQDSPGLHFMGKMEDESLRIDGEALGNRGRVEYLETRFKVESFGCIFTPAEIFPEVYGTAYTTIRDSLNVPNEIYLKLYAIDPITKQEVQRGRWEDFRFKLVSTDPVVGENQELVLQKMGYSVQNISSKASEVGSQLTENYLIRPLIRPVERLIERKLNLDYVRFNSAVAKNILNYSLGRQVKWWYRENSLNSFNPGLAPNPALLLLQSSEVTLGKYLDRNLFLSYTAQVMSLYESSEMQLNQKLNLEYRFLRNWLLEVEYDYFKNLPQYYNYEAPHDMTIRLRHSFTF